MNEPGQIHPDASSTPTAEQIQAWESLSPQQQQETIDQLNQIIAGENLPEATSPGTPVEFEAQVAYANVFGLEESTDVHVQLMNAKTPLSYWEGPFDSFASPKQFSRQIDPPCEECGPDPTPTPGASPTPTPTATPTPGLRQLQHRVQTRIWLAFQTLLKTHWQMALRQIILSQVARITVPDLLDSIIRFRKLSA
ncbi:MAG: hypothetical protein ACRD6X_16230, partial [Pyrinomonadaceae bacterium]